MDLRDVGASCVGVIGEFSCLPWVLIGKGPAAVMGRLSGGPGVLGEAVEQVTELAEITVCGEVVGTDFDEDGGGGEPGDAVVSGAASGDVQGAAFPCGQVGADAVPLV